MSDKAFEYTNEMAAYDLLVIDDSRFSVVEAFDDLEKSLHLVMSSSIRPKSSFHSFRSLNGGICLVTAHTLTSASAG